MKLSRQVQVIVLLIALFVGALALVAMVMQPPREDMVLFAFLLATPVLVAGVGATVARRQAWWRQFHSVALALFITYAIGAGLILLTVYVTARLMFISAHDANLALVIVVFATVVTLVFGYFVAVSLRDVISNIMRAARAVQQGDLTVTADDRGSDELASLARTFNEMTAQLRALREQETQLNQARRDLIAWVSHDLRTPLTAMRARIEALNDGVVSDPREVSEYLVAIRTDISALNRLIDDLFELATIEAGGLNLDMADCSLSDLVSDTIKAMSVLATTRGIQLTGKVSPDVGIICVSAQHVQRILNNLIGNAIAHTPSGGCVNVESNWDDSIGSVVVRISDTGEGISAVDLPHIFERFYRGERSRARSSGSGMGLGLAIAKALVEAHRGRIYVESESGKGTSVWFTLPRE
ncbi:MAG TPA: HAMP domain-containing sensor histidine kinase [Anaerolineae bacterium]|jgi:signal transduction histidine kinase